MSLPRPRLLELLAEALQRPLTLVCAPAGFGKSTLFSAWASDAVDRPAVAWLSIDEDDNDPARFFDYLERALRLSRGERQRMTGTLPGSGPPIAKERMECLLDDLADTDDQAVLVLDDYQHIRNDEIDDAVAFLVEHLPAHLRVVIATRCAPNLPLPRWRARRWMTEIGTEQLRFTAEEATAFMVRTMGISMDPASVSTLAQRTEGWVAGLQIAALSLQQLRDTQGNADLDKIVSAFSGEHRHVMDYLAGEVLQQQSPDLQEFARMTSVLDRLSAELCDAVTRRTDSRRLLAAAERANLFLRRLDDRGRWFRYHQLFADFLRNRLDEPEKRALHERASAWFERQGMGDEAIKHALAARDVDGAMRLFRSLVEDRIARGELPTLLAWLDLLPDSTVRQHRDLAGYKAWLLFMSGRTLEAQEFHAASVEVGKAATAPPANEMMFALEAFLAINSDHPERAIELSEQALAHLGTTTSFFRVWPLFYKGLGLLRSGRPRAAMETLRQALDLGWAFGQRMAALDALGHLAPLMCAQGQLREAELLCREFLARCSPADEAHAPISGLVLVPLGMLAFARNELAEAAELLEAGTALCRRLGSVFHAISGTCSLARVQHARGAREQAWNTMAAARSLADRSRNPRRQRVVLIAAADLHLRDGNAEAALRTLEGQLHGDEPAADAELVQARALLAGGRTLAAMRILNDVEARCRHDAQEGTLVTIHLLQAAGHRSNGGRAATLVHLEKAVSLAASGGYVRPFLDADRALIGLVRHVAHAAPEFVNTLLETLRPPSAAVPVPVADGEGLTKTQLAVLHLVSQGLANQQIATSLGITVGTAKWHVSQIYEKLGVRNRGGAIAKARASKLV